MASAIVRSRIANSSLDEVLVKRQELREAIRDEMSIITKGWGVWLETVEITDVKILSSSLFNDLQCNYREKQNKEATLLRINVDTKIEIEKDAHKLQQNKRAKDKEVRDLVVSLQKTLVAKIATVAAKKQSVKLAKQKLDETILNEIFKSQETNKKTKEYINLSLEDRKL